MTEPSAAEALLALALPHADPARAEGEQAYLKLPHWTFLGVATPPLRQAVRAWAKEHKGLDHDGLWAIVDELWDEPGPTFEHRRLVSLLVERHWKLLRPGDAPRLEQLLATSETWALVDCMAVAVGKAVPRDPAWSEVLDAWAVHPSFWLRRSALLALLPTGKKGAFDWPRFTRYAEPMLAEKEFFIRKALGWVLRAAAHRDPEAVAAWLSTRAALASGLTVREACKHLDEAVKEELMAAQKERRLARLPA